MVRAMTDVSSGEEIIFSYLPCQDAFGGPNAQDWGVLQRRSFLMQEKGFLCLCPCCQEQEQVSGKSVASPPFHIRMAASASTSGLLKELIMIVDLSEAMRVGCELRGCEVGHSAVRL